MTLNVSGNQLNSEIKLQIEIVDQGLGIPDDQKERVFQRFYQSPSAKGKEMGGVGIGLSFAAQLSKLLGGELVLKSSSTLGLLPLKWQPCSVLLQHANSI